MAIKNNNFLHENEKTANKVVAQVMRISFVVFTLIYIMDIVGIFKVSMDTMTISYFSGSVMLLLPSLFVNIMKKQGSYIKYLNVIGAAIFITLLSTTLTYHVVALYIYPIAIASLYFSKSLNILATVLTVAGVSVGQYLAFVLQTLQDDRKGCDFRNYPKDTCNYCAGRYFYDAQLTDCKYAFKSDGSRGTGADAESDEAGA